MTSKTSPSGRPVYDTFHMGRSCMDLYSNDVGADFVDIKSFAAYVGGSPTNMSVGCRRLGLQSALLTAFGEDPVGDFVVHFLENEGVEVRFCPRKKGRYTSLVVLGIEPPDKFPLVFYRDNCADIALEIADVEAAPVAESRVFQFAGTNLSREPSRSATLHAAEMAHRAGADVVLDLDFRPDQWHDPCAYGVTIRSMLAGVDIVLGTEDEINAALMTDPRAAKTTHSQLTDVRVAGDTARHVQTILDYGPGLVVEKRGKQGCRLHRCGQPAEDVPGFKVQVQNILGAGQGLGALQGRPAGQCLRRHGRGPARVFGFHAHPGRGDGFCGSAGRALKAGFPPCIPGASDDRIPISQGEKKRMPCSIAERFDLSGRVAAITGAGGALCGAMADALGAAGVQVAVIDLDADKAGARVRAIDAAGGSARAFVCDVLDAAALKGCCRAVCEQWGPPDFLINGAGGNDPRGSTSVEFHPAEDDLLPDERSFFDLGGADFRRVFDLNFMGAFITSQVFGREMVARGRGAILNMSSMSAFTPLTKVPAYSAAKAALSNFTQWLAVHFAHTGVRVNALAPGFFMTEQLKFLHIDRETGGLLPRAQKVVAHTPMGRYGQPDDLIGAMIWLLSDASSFVTGAVVPIDGGFSTYTI
jgi:5-dehydro-2-deoxygluconokinase